MAAAASSPELFINCVGTFVTKSDLGVGAIVGSAVFNVLAVPACCGLFAGKVWKKTWNQEKTFLNFFSKEETNEIRMFLGDLFGLVASEP